MISAIIPTYKEPEYLDLCLQSAFEGRTDKKTEIVVVVDGFMDLNKSVLDKYPDTTILDLETNQGLSVATNWGVYNAKHDNILVVNDDNVFPNQWDDITEDIEYGNVITPNQIEPNPSMFRQFHIKDLGQSPQEFNLETYWEYAENLASYEIDNTGCTLPFAMKKTDYLAVGGWDVMYPSPHVVDWDFFLKCEYVGYNMKRSYAYNFYHFAGAATRKTPEQSAESTRKEQLAHQFFANKWGRPAKHNPQDNSKMLDFP